MHTTPPSQLTTQTVSNNKFNLNEIKRIQNARTRPSGGYYKTRKTRKTHKTRKLKNRTRC